jgi:hypothetical protein
MNDENFIKTCNEASSMIKASKILNISFSSFKRRAEKLGCYKPNQAGKGTIKKRNCKNTIDEILQGGIEFQSFKLKNRLLKEGIFEHRCMKCDLTE